MPSPTVSVRRFDLGAGTRFDSHVHEVHQIVWTGSGVVAVDVDGRTWVLPPTLALWVPAGVRHTTWIARPGTMRGIYVRTSAFAPPWRRPVVVAVPGLMRELLDFLDDAVLPGAVRHRAEALLMDVLRPVAVAPITLPMPTDLRAVAVARGVLEHPGEGWSLEEWGRRVGASVRTLTRLFVAETGLTFAQWRTNAHLRVALSCLADGMSTSATARQAGYSTPSAFVAAFRRATGQTPGAYFADLVDADGAASPTDVRYAT
jgi:AraC-like DNA-binding protein